MFRFVRFYLMIILCIMSVNNSALAGNGNSCVAELQAKFNNSGFNAGIVDGLYGSNTETAGNGYAMENGLQLPVLDGKTLIVWCDEFVLYEAVEPTLITQGSTGNLTEERLVALKDIAMDVLKERLSYKLNSPLTIFASADDPEWLTDNLFADLGLTASYRQSKVYELTKCDHPAEQAGSTIIFCLNPKGESARTWSTRSPTDSLRIAGHELFHGYQSNAAGSIAYEQSTHDHDKMPPLGPMWLSEGSAEYFAKVILDDNGQIPLSHSVNSAKRQAIIRTSDDLRLLERNTRNGYAELDSWKSLHVGLLATHRLVQLTGSYDSIVNFYRYIGFGQSAEVSFTNAFGLSMKEFETQFKEHWDEDKAWQPSTPATLT